jgi:hypothetical protein
MPARFPVAGTHIAVDGGVLVPSEAVVVGAAGVVVLSEGNVVGAAVVDVVELAAVGPVRSASVRCLPLPHDATTRPTEAAVAATLQRADL